MFKLSAEHYKTNLSKGFITLQQRQEFVDVTLAAEGHLVKAHQSILAVSSPYLKELMQSIPCQHPVIYLCNVSHTSLQYIVEYLYTGEVQIPSNMVQAFMKAAKEMYITGLQGIIIPQNLEAINRPEADVLIQSMKIVNCENVNTRAESVPVVNTNDYSSNSKRLNTFDGISKERNCVSNSYGSEININSEFENFNLPINNEIVLANNNIMYEQPHIQMLNENEANCQLIESDVNCPLNNNSDTSAPIDDAVMDQQTNSYQNSNITYDVQDENKEMDTENICYKSDTSDSNLNATTEMDKQAPTFNTIEIHDITDYSHRPLYSTSTRGNIQMIHNRYIYNMHHKSNFGQHQRWRCIEYRKAQCLAYIDTLQGNIISRKNLHKHSFHDSKIISLGKKNKILESIPELYKK